MTHCLGFSGDHHIKVKLWQLYIVVFEEILNIVPNPRRLVSQPSVACRDNLVVTGGPIRLLQLVINIHAVCGTERPSDRSSVSCMTIYLGNITKILSPNCVEYNLE
jgi:hypothetical protein